LKETESQLSEEEQNEFAELSKKYNDGWDIIEQYRKEAEELKRQIQIEDAETFSLQSVHSGLPQKMKNRQKLIAECTMLAASVLGLTEKDTYKIKKNSRVHQCGFIRMLAG